jgi:chromosome segregation ATPase
MKRILISLLAAAFLPAMAQTANPGAKVDPKNNKVSRPVVEKAQPKLMSRDELRACLKTNDENVKEADQIKAAQASYKANTAELLKEKEELQKIDDDARAEIASVKAERESILMMFEEIKAAAPKLEKADLAARNKEYQTRAAAFDARVTAMNELIKANGARRASFGERVDAVNASFKVLEERTEAHFDKTDAWKKDCQNKPYDEADEIALKKERAAAGK